MRLIPFVLVCLIASLAAAETFEKAERIARKQGNRALKKSAAELSEDDLRNYVTRLASEQYEGRGTGDKGERMATSYLASFFNGLGLSPEVPASSFFHTFDFAAGMRTEGANDLSFADKASGGLKSPVMLGKDYQPLSISTSGKTTAEAVFAGFGIAAGDYDSFSGIEPRGRWIVVFRGVPTSRPELRGSGPLLVKANLAKEKGAAGIIFVKGTNEEIATELFPLSQEIGGAPILPALCITDRLAAPLLTGKEDQGALKELFRSYSEGEKVEGFSLKGAISSQIGIVKNREEGRNVIARLVSGSKPAAEAIMIGAHIDHLGYGNRGGTRARGEDAKALHYGADDNASGVAAMMELAQYFTAQKAKGSLTLKRDLIFAGWSGEEMGLFGSTAYVEEGKKEGNLYPRIAAYINLDMVGRLREQGLNVQGTGSSGEWDDLLNTIDTAEDGMTILRSSSPFLPTDTTPLYNAGVPILSIFTGLHDDYHTPRDTIETLNFPGLLKVTSYVKDMALQLTTIPKPPGYIKVERNARRPAPRVLLGIRFEGGESGLRVTDVQEESAASRSGLREGDVLRKLDGKNIDDREALIAVLLQLEPGETYPIQVARGQENLTFQITPDKR